MTKNIFNRLTSYLLIPVMFLLLFSNGTSPLVKYYYGSDSAFFMFFGKAMNHGLLPYIDLFDHKGPYLFFIQWIGQLIAEGKIGAFIMQVINMVINMFIINKIFTLANNELTIKKKILLYIPIGILFSITFRDGNMCEEYSLLFLFASLYMTIKYFISCDNGNYKHDKRFAFFYGLFFIILVFIRMTNSAFLCACVLTIFILLLIHKEYKNLFENIIYFFLGVLVGLLPILIYFKCINGLEEMLQSVFVYAFKYSNETSLKYKYMVFFTVKNIVLMCSGVLPILILIIRKRIKDKYFVLSVISFIATFLAIFLGFGFTHYFVLVLPNLLLGIFLYLNDEKIINNRIFKYLVIIVLILQSIYMFESLGKNILQMVDYSISEKTFGYYENQEKQDKEIGNQIPKEDKYSVWGYGIKARFYLRTDTYPCIKYFDYLDQRFAYEEIRDEIEELLNLKQPKWLVIDKDKDDIPELIEKEINNHYSLYFENESYYLYTRN